MKYSRLISVFFLLFAVFKIQAQNDSDSNGKWVRIEIEKSKISFAVPPNYLVDAEKRQYGQRFRLISFRKGLEIQFEHRKNPNGFFFIGPQPNPFKVGDFTVHKMDSAPDDSKFSTTLLIIDKTTQFSFRVVAKNADQPEVRRFLYSIKVQNKPLFVMKETQNWTEETISAADLQTSPEVIEAFDRKIDKSFVKINLSAVIGDANDEETADLTRPVIILERPGPDFSPPRVSTNSTINTYRSSFKVQFLANGQIGEITVLSSTGKDFTNSCIESVKKIRFIPAQKDGKNVDAFETVDYMLQFSSAPIIIR